MTTPVPEARYLELAARPGNETLRQECSNKNLQDNQGMGGVLIYGYHLLSCDCQGRGWLPLPEAERLGVLIRLTLNKGIQVKFTIKKGRINCWLRTPFKVFDCVPGVNPEAALVEALLAAVKE